MKESDLANHTQDERKRSSVPLKEAELPFAEWKPCFKCNGGRRIDRCNLANGTNLDYCPHCQGHGVEPVEVENPKICVYKGKLIEGYKYKHQVGVPFGVFVSMSEGKKIFLPLRPKVEGDLSVLMVVKVN